MATTEATTDDLRERVSRLEGGYEHVATKADLANLETRMETRFAQIDARFAQIEARFTQMETRMDVRFAQMETRLLLKFGGLAIATAGVAVAVLRLLG